MESIDKWEQDSLRRQHNDPDFLLCRHGVKYWTGDDPCCAFDEAGNFRENNWNCFLMTKVRELCGQWDEDAPGNCWWDEDQYYGVIYIPTWFAGEEVKSPLRGCFVLMDWYKSRGRTDSFRILAGDIVRQGTEEDAEEIAGIFEDYLEEVARRD